MRIRCLRDIMCVKGQGVGDILFAAGNVYVVQCNCSNDAEECECIYEGVDEHGDLHFLSIEYIRENFEILS